MSRHWIPSLDLNELHQSSIYFNTYKSCRNVMQLKYCLTHRGSHRINFNSIIGATGDAHFNYLSYAKTLLNKNLSGERLWLHVGTAKCTSLFLLHTWGKLLVASYRPTQIFLKKLPETRILFCSAWGSNVWFQHEGTTQGYILSEKNLSRNFFSPKLFYQESHPFIICNMLSISL